MTMKEVIAQAARDNPEGFSNGLLAIARGHLAYSEATHDARSSAIAVQMNEDATRMAIDVSYKRLDVERLTFSQMIIAFGMASKVIGLTREQINECRVQPETSNG